MKNLSKYLLFAALATGIAACSKSDTEAPPPDTRSSVRVTHTNRSYSAPQFDGSSPAGMIDWGDRSYDRYAPGLVHDYAEAGFHTVACDMQRADRVRFPDLAGVERIDLSKF